MRRLTLATTNPEPSIRTPAAAAVAGIVFAVIFGAVLVLMRSAVPVDPADGGTWLASRSKRDQVDLALALIPFAGIAFLWFMGVIRDHLGAREDKFVATVLFGSGLLFVGMLFVGGSVAASLIALESTARTDPQVWSLGRRVAFNAVNVYALRMAAVFLLATTTLGGRVGAIPKWLMAAGYLTAVMLLLAVTRLPDLDLLFPIWVLTLSIYVLVSRRARTRLEAGGAGPESAP